jgi:hypothetical protein
VFPVNAASKCLYGYNIVAHVLDQSIAHFRAKR